MSDNIITEEMIEKARMEFDILHLCAEGVLNRTDDELICALMTQLNKVLEEMLPIFDKILPEKPFSEYPE